MFCENCGKSLEESTKFCPSCGFPVFDDLKAEEPDVSSQDSDEAEETATDTVNNNRIRSDSSYVMLLILTIVISIAILAASVFGVGVLAAKIYRLGVLMYGNPPKLGKLIKQVLFKK